MGTTKDPSSKISTRDKILTAASDLFSRQGYSAVSIRNISRQVDIRESSFYNHFQSKEDLLDEIFNIFESQFAELRPNKDIILETLEATGPETYLWEAHRRFVEFWDTPLRRRAKLIVFQEQFRNTRAVGLITQFTQLFVDAQETVFLFLAEKNVIKNADPALLSRSYGYALMAMLHEYDLLKGSGRSTYDIVNAIFNHIRFFLQTVRST